MDAFFDDSVGAMANLLTKVIDRDIVAIGRAEFLWLLSHAVLGTSLIESSSEKTITNANLLWLLPIADPSIKESKSLVILMILLDLNLLVAKGLSILLKLPRKRVLGAARMIGSCTTMWL